MRWIGPLMYALKVNLIPRLFAKQNKLKIMFDKIRVVICIQRMNESYCVKYAINGKLCSS